MLKTLKYKRVTLQFSIAFCWLLFLFFFFFLTKVVFEGSSHGFYGEEFLVAVDNVVFLTDKCGERPSRGESPERTKTQHCSYPMAYCWSIFFKSRLSIAVNRVWTKRGVGHRLGHGVPYDLPVVNFF